MSGTEKNISRSSILYGCSSDDCWFDLELFYRDHINEINQKLTQLDDEIWGKIIMMERNKRVAKAYLRTTTVIVDGGCFGFDGKTIGFNSFENPNRDHQVEEIKSKIGEGVILKMDQQGNIIAMARGVSPVIVQGARQQDGQCYSDKVMRLKGKLEPMDYGSEHHSKDRAVKVFDMKIFKAAIEKELRQPYPNRKDLLFKTCIRISLVKDEGHPLKTPVWFMIVNLVALDMLNAKVPINPGGTPSSPNANNPSFLQRRTSDELQRPQSISQSNSDIYGTVGGPGDVLGRLLATNPQLALAAAASGGFSGPWAQAQLQQPAAAAQMPQIDQLAQIANTLALGYDPAVAAPRSSWRPTSCGYLSETDTSNIMRRQRVDTKPKARPLSTQCRWGGNQSMDELYEPVEAAYADANDVGTGDDDENDEEDDEEDLTSASRLAARAAVPQPQKNFTLRPQPSYKAPAPPSQPCPTHPPKKLYPQEGAYPGFKSQSPWSSGSTSDYESTKDIYDSSTCSSSSRSSNSVNSVNSAGERSSSPSLVSETASESQTSDSGYTESTPVRPLRPNRTTLDVIATPNLVSTGKHHIPAEAAPQVYAAAISNRPSHAAPLPPKPPDQSINGSYNGSVVNAQAQLSQPPKTTGFVKFMKSRRILKAGGLFNHRAPATAGAADSSTLESSESSSSDVEWTFVNRKSSPPVPPHRRKKAAPKKESSIKNHNNQPKTAELNITLQNLNFTSNRDSVDQNEIVYEL